MTSPGFISISRVCIKITLPVGREGSIEPESTIYGKMPEKKKIRQNMQIEVPKKEQLRDTNFRNFIEAPLMNNRNEYNIEMNK